MCDEINCYDKISKYHIKLIKICLNHIEFSMEFLTVSLITLSSTL